MLLRFSAIRRLTVLICITTTTYIFFSRWLIPRHFSYDADDRSIASSSQNEGSSFLPLVFKDTPMYDELAEFRSPPVRISPAQLNKPAAKREYTSNALPYNEKSYRQSSTPILWIDEYGDVRWNRAAENSMLNYLTQKQFPRFDQIKNRSLTKKAILQICRTQTMFLLHQHWSGFFSRVLCFIAQFGQTLYSPRIAVLRGNRFGGERGERDDFLSQGIKRYFLPMSICSAYEEQPDMTELKDLIHKENDALYIARTSDLHEHGGGKTNRLLYASEFWKMDYHHVPIRKWLFDRKQSSVLYSSSAAVLSNHSDEHIYAPKNEKNYPIGKWIDINRPDAFSSDLLVKDKDYKLTWKDYVFGSFLRYMFALFFKSQNAPRIEYATRVLAQHWSSFLRNKYATPSNTNVFDKLAGLYIRRGDKATEDSFWAKHGRWRNLSLYVKGIIDEEQRRKTTFSYIFIMTDDTSVMESFLDYANPESKGKDEPYAREHLRGREILYNILAPQKCFYPFHRVGFDQFLVSMRFLIQYSSFNIGHTDSNVFRFLRDVLYAQRQHRPNVQSFTYVQNAPDYMINNNNQQTNATIKQH